MLVKNIEFELGSINTVISLKNQGIIYNEPTLIAIDITRNNIIAVGNVASRFVGRAGEKIKVIEPMKDGIIIDASNMIKMIKFILKKEHVTLVNAIASVVVPVYSSQMDFIMYECIFKSLGFKKIQIKYIPFRISNKNENTFVIDPTGIMIFNNDNILISYKNVDISDKIITDKIQNILSKEYSIITSKSEIERVLKVVDTSKEDTETVLIKGKNAETKIPMVLEFDINIIRNLVNEKIENITTDILEMRKEVKGKCTFNINNVFNEKYTLKARIKQCLTS